MGGFFESFLPIIKKYRIEALLLAVALIVLVFSTALYLKSAQTEVDDEESLIEKNTSRQSSIKIILEVGGAVEKPDVYEVVSGARLRDVLVMAGGLSDEADRGFFSRNFNLARVVADQEKIYIPSTAEIQNGMFVDYNQPTVAGVSTWTNINTASLGQLDQLPGIGKTTAQKIIEGRPYHSLEELLTKKIIKKNIYENIKSLISL